MKEGVVDGVHIRYLSLWYIFIISVVSWLVSRIRIIRCPGVTDYFNSMTILLGELSVTDHFGLFSLYLSCRDSVYFMLTTTYCRFETIHQFWHLFNLLFIFFQISNEHCAAYLPHKYMIRALCLWGSYGWNVEYSKDVLIIHNKCYWI